MQFDQFDIFTLLTITELLCVLLWNGQDTNHEI